MQYFINTSIASTVTNWVAALFNCQIVWCKTEYNTLALDRVKYQSRANQGALPLKGYPFMWKYTPISSTLLFYYFSYQTVLFIKGRECCH